MPLLAIRGFNLCYQIAEETLENNQPALKYARRYTQGRVSQKNHSLGNQEPFTSIFKPLLPIVYC